MGMENNNYYGVLDLKSIIYTNEQGDMCTEEWRAIPNYPSYEISDLGRVKSIDRTTFDIKGRKYNRIGRILSLGFNGRGYLQIGLKRNDGVYKTNRVHRLVMLIFVGKSNLEVDHKNGIKTDNRLENLRYCTTRENSHFYRNKLKKSSAYIGVTKHKNKYCANIRIGKESFYLGIFESAEQANESYTKALYEWKNLGLKPQPIEKNYASRQEGVTWIARSLRWSSRINIEGKRMHIGYYKTEVEAIDAYLIAKYNWETFKKYPPKATFLSKHKGISFDRQTNKWIAFVRKNGNSKRIGSSKTEEGAYEILTLYLNKENQ